MKHIIALLLGLSMNALVYSQVLTNLNDPEAISDSLQEFANREVANDSLRIHRPVITDYTYWRENDLTPSRSEEHTSELQSRGHLVCRLLLEKKKKNIIVKTRRTN